MRKLAGDVCLFHQIKQDSRGEIPALSGQDGDIDIVTHGNISQGLGNGIVSVHPQSIEFLVVVDGDGGYTPRVRDLNYIRHGVYVYVYTYVSLFPPRAFMCINVDK